MSSEFWAIIGVGAGIIFTIDLAAKQISKKLDVLTDIIFNERRSRP